MMVSKYGMQSDPKENIGNCGLFLWFSDFALYLQDNLMYNIIRIVSQYVTICDPNIKR